MAGHGEAEIRKYVKTCIAVFSSLMVLTVVTVAISYVHLDTPSAIAVALIVATVKASLVALFASMYSSTCSRVQPFVCNPVSTTSRTARNSSPSRRPKYW